MEWNNLFSPLRTGALKTSRTEDARTDYQRDFDRLIFSSAFRRLQDKTQVFPLPGSTFVHNRLTHSLEVASVGRSIGSIIGEHIVQNDIQPSDQDSKLFYQRDLSNIIAAGCLAHDIGNPAFGHSGEDAISNYFLHMENEKIESASLRSYFSEKEWADLTHFEGNANALRVLAQNFQGKIEGGLGLTVTTLASIFKYPCGSSDIDNSKKHRKKYSYFQSEKDLFHEVTGMLDFIKDPEAPSAYKRHPFVYLVEAADDICYRIVDMEDAHRIKIISKQTITDALMAVIEQKGTGDKTKFYETFKSLKDDNAAISYLRAKCIGTLVQGVVEKFIENKDLIIQCAYENTLMDDLERECPALKEVESISIEKIYNHDSVIEIEIAGYNVMKELLGMFVPAVLKHQSNRSSFEKQVLKLIPNQFKSYDTEQSAYLKVMNILDHVSAMTDIYATDLYRKIKGIEISKHS